MGTVRADLKVLPDGTRLYTVVDRNGTTIEDVETYLNYLRTIDSSTNTIRAYARHLALFFRWLDQRGGNWENLTFDGLCAFGTDLMDGTLRSVKQHGQLRPAEPRSRATCEAVMAAVYSFLDYWKLEGRLSSDLRMYREGTNRRSTTYSFLAHVAHKSTMQERRVRFRGPRAKTPQIIDFEADFARLLDAATSHRDRALLSAMYDGGLRISQALGLRHDDLDIARRRVRVVRRTDNANGALSKQRTDFTVDLPQRFFSLYALSLTDEQLVLDIDSDYVFVNLTHRHRGAPMKYANAVQVVQSIGRRAGIGLTPHTLRHTHGTALAKLGWSAPQIAARLGQSSNTSADVYIHLAADDLAEKYAESELAARDS